MLFYKYIRDNFWQLTRYGAVGVMTTVLQTGVFYFLAATSCKCLTSDDWAVRVLGLPSVAYTGCETWYASRWFMAAIAISVGFVIADLFCWIMNRFFVFKAGKYVWYIEFGMFFTVDLLAAIVAVALQSVLIDVLHMSTTVAMLSEIVVSFVINYLIRKKMIFQG